MRLHLGARMICFPVKHVRVFDYILAVFLVIADAALKDAVPPLDREPLALWMPAVALSLWAGGFGPGVLATIMSLVLALTIFSAPPSLHDDWGAVVFVASGVLICSLFADVHTARERLRLRRIAEQDVSNALLSAILACDEDDTITYVNAATQRLFGYSEQEMVGMPVTLIMRPEDREKHTAGLRRWRETGVRTMDWGGVQFRGLTRDRREMDLWMRLVPADLGDRLLVVGVIWHAELVERYDRDLLHDVFERGASHGNTGPT